MPTYGPTPFPSPLPTLAPTLAPTPVPTVSPTTYCYEPCPESMEGLYTFMQTLGEDMVHFLNGGYHEVLSRVDALYPDQPDWEDQGQQPGGKSQYDQDDANGEHNPDGLDDDDDDTYVRSDGGRSSRASGASGPSSSRPQRAGGSMPSSLGSRGAAESAEGLELRRMVAGFAAQAHLATDLGPTALRDLQAQTAAARAPELAAAGSSSSGSGGYGGSGPQATVSAVTAALVACAAFALGAAFQNQKAWADVSSRRFSRAEYTALL